MPNATQTAYTEFHQSENSQNWLDEFRQSAIPDRLTRANVTFHERGAEALQETLTEAAIANVQKSPSFVGKQAARILDRYTNALFGGWVALGTTLDGGEGAVAMVKLSKPREAAAFQGFGKAPQIKTVKYETPADCPALPILPFVDPETAQAIYDRHGVTPLEGENFWRSVQRSGCPIAVTEGLKKALHLIAHGIPAIALRGVACWHPKGEKHLYQQIADFATEGRKIYIVFDQDLKPATVKAVGIQIRQFGKALEKCGADVRIMAWHPEEGKGIDDAVFAKGDGGQAWLDDVIESAQTLKNWVKSGRVKQLKDAIRRAKDLPFAPDRDTEGGYLPEVPSAQPGTITVIAAPTGAGKTHAIAAQVKSWVATGGNVLMLYPLNALGQQAAQRCELPHIKDYWMEGGGEGQAGRAEFHSAIQGQHGAVLCYDSLHHIPDWFYRKPLLLILDEVNQGLEHLSEGGTLKERQAEIIGRFAAAAKVAGQNGAVVVAEAEVYPHSVKLIQQVSGIEAVKYYRHDRRCDRGRVEITSTINGGALVSQALTALGRGEKIMWCTSSQKNARRLEYILQKHGYVTMRIDSETNRGDGDGLPSPFVGFFDSPDQFLAAEGCPDALIVSPTCKTGLSIEQPWFDRVFGYFPNCGPDTALQMLARYRQPAPRHVAMPPFVNTSGYESISTAKGIKGRIAFNQKASTQYLGLDAIAAAEDDQSAAVMAAIVDFYAASTALVGAQKQIAYYSLADTLFNERFEVIEVAPDRCSAGEAEMREARESIWREDAETLATAEPLENWRDYDNKPCTLEVEWAATKGKLTELYTSMDWNSREVCYYCITRIDGLMMRSVDLQAICEDLGAANLIDRPGVESAKQSGLAHKAPTAHLKALLLNKIGVLDLLEDGLILSNDSEVCIRVADAARRYRKDLKFYSGLTAGDECLDGKKRTVNSDIKICGKLLKILGLELLNVSRRGSGRNRERQYEVAAIVPKNYADTLEDRPNLEAADRLKAWQYRRDLLNAARERLARLKQDHQPQPPTEPKPQPESPPDTPTESIGVEVDIEFEDGEVEYFSMEVEA
jgi:Domain of unknown function (DUF3854)